jgi:hypothetical protein
MVLTPNGFVPIEANAGDDGKNGDTGASGQNPNAQTAASVQKYSPDQPRIPAGNSDGGQWTSGDGGQNGNGASGTVVVAARTRRNQAECDEQLKLDEFICRSVRTPLCWAQAMERYAACLADRQIPPLNF